MVKKLIFNGYQAEDLGFVVVEGANEVFVKEEYEVVNIEGRSGSLIVNKGTYSDIEKTFTITAIDYDYDDGIEEMIDNIKRWLFDVTDNRLFYSYDDRYNIVKKVIFTEDVRTTFEEFGDFQVTFLCEPFYYKDEEELIISGTTSKNYTNDGDFESFPHIRIHATGSVYFNINHVKVEIKNVTTYAEIDTKLLTCLDSEGKNKINDLVSDFPTFNRGENLIEVPTGQSITKIEIIPRTIYR